MTRNMLNFFAKAFREYERRGRGFGRVGEGWESAISKAWVGEASGF